MPRGSDLAVEWVIGNHQGRWRWLCRGAVVCVTAMMVLVCDGGCAARRSHFKAGDDRHAFAIARMGIREMPKPGDAAATLVMRGECPVTGEYAVLVLYDVDLRMIDVQYPGMRRPSAAGIAETMRVGLRVAVADERSGRNIAAEPGTPTVFDASTRDRRWSGERLATFLLKGGSGYRVTVDITDASPAWLALNPTLVLDPREEVVKSPAWLIRGRDP